MKKILLSIVALVMLMPVFAFGRDNVIGMKKNDVVEEFAEIDYVVESATNDTIIMVNRGRQDVVVTVGLKKNRVISCRIDIQGIYKFNDIYHTCMSDYGKKPVIYTDSVKGDVIWTWKSGRHTINLALNPAAHSIYLYRYKK